MGTLFKKKGSDNWQMGVCVNGQQVCKSTHTTNEKMAKKLLAQWETEVFEGRFRLIKTNAPTLEEWAAQFLLTIPHLKTRLRYTSSVNNIKPSLGRLRLSRITADLVEDFKDERLAKGIGPATVNRDLAVLRRMLKLAERKRFIARSPFCEVEFLEERGLRRKPHIVSYEEEERILQVADPHIRTLVVTQLETGMRPNRETLMLKWEDVDLGNDVIRVRESKTKAGVRNIPLSARCRAELLAWRNRLGPEFSPYVFPNMRNPQQPVKDIRRAWAKALKLAGIEYFWLYHLRHTFASRLSAAGVSDLFVAQMIGHSTPGIVQTYAKAVDEYRRDAIRRMERMRQNPESQEFSSSAIRPN
jgi:integrase